MKRLIFILFLSLQVLTVLGQSTETMPANLVIKNVSVITMGTDTVLKNKDVIIIDGKIRSISGTGIMTITDVPTLDGTGKYMMPSLADAHVHFPKEESELERMMALYLISGVTKLRSMRGDWKHVEWRKKHNADGSVNPKLYLSPPPISRSYEFTPSQIEDYVKASKERGFDFLKILSVKDEAVFTQFDISCKSHNLPIAGHFPSNIPDSQIFSSNYTSFEHLGGLTGDAEYLEIRLESLKKLNIFICPTLSWYSIGSGRYSYDELRKLPGMEFVKKGTVDEWIDKTREYREKLGSDAYEEEVANELKSLEEKYQIIKKLQASGIPMLLSPDSSSKYMTPGFDMVGEMELLKNAELSNYEILKMATTNFADFFNEDYGVIKVGGKADFILLNTNPLEDLNTLKNIEGLYFKNQFLNVEKLGAMRAQLLELSQN